VLEKASVLIFYSAPHTQFQRPRVRSHWFQSFSFPWRFLRAPFPGWQPPSAARGLIKSENSRLFIFVLFPELPRDYPIFGKAEFFGIIVTLP